MRISDWSSDVCSSDLVEESNRTATKVSVRVDGGRVYEPALSQYPGFGSLIPTPSVKTGLREDVYLTITRLADSPGDDVTLRVIIQPMAVWLWIGGGAIAFGTLLAAWPGRRRGPTDPVSARVALAGYGPVPALGTEGSRDEEPGPAIPVEPAGRRGRAHV